MGACSYVLSNMSARVYIYVQCICGWAHDITLTPEGQRNNSEPTKISWKTQICIGTCANICLPCISACTCTCVKKNYTCWPAYLFIFEVCVSLHIMDKTIMKKMDITESTNTQSLALPTLTQTYGFIRRPIVGCRARIFQGEQLPFLYQCKGQQGISEALPV